MKRLAIILLAVVACKTAAPAPPAPMGSQTGASSPRTAVELFMRAVKAQDLQAMSAIWGTEKGPARETLSRDQVDKRELIMQCYLGHDTYHILSSVPAQNGTTAFQVSLTKGPLTRQTTVSTVRGPSNRWYVDDVAIPPVKDLCRESAGG